MTNEVRRSARAIVVSGEQLLVIHRNRCGLVYATLPGGGLEPGESDAAAAERELAEETSLCAAAERVIAEDGDGNVFVLMGPATGEVALGGAEALAHSQENSYEPAWVDVTELARINLLPVGARVLVQELIGSKPG